MEEINLTPKELKSIIDKEKAIGFGFFGAVITYGSKLLKIDKGLYQKLKDAQVYESNYIVDTYYHNNGKKDFQDRNQIEELVNKQKDIKLTKLPLGIITLKDVSKDIYDISPGIIIPYHKGYDKLENLNYKNYKRLLIILKKLLLAVKELEDNRIAQEDLIQYNEFDIVKRQTNVLYKDYTPEIIDMSGFFVKVGNTYIDSKNMYRDLSDIFLDYCFFNGLKSSFTREKVTTYEENKEILSELESYLKGKVL